MEVEKTYSWLTGVVYLFNIMIGSGLLAIPKPFAEVGLVLGLIVIIVVAGISYATATFVLECLSIYNAITKHSNKPQTSNGPDNTVIENKQIQYAMDEIKEGNVETSKRGDENTMMFDLTLKTDWTDICQMFFNKIGFFIYNIVISLQLYGIISLFFAMVAKSLTSITCGDINWNLVNSTTACVAYTHFTVIQIYYISLACFACIMIPFAYFDVTTTKWIQFFTLIYRILAIMSMIILPLIKIKSSKQIVKPKMADFSKFPNYFGASLFLMACQTAIPTIVTPISDRRKMKLTIFFPFLAGVIVVVSFVLPVVFAFKIDDVQDLYTLNFSHPLFSKYFLELFPVVSLASTLPVTAIVLRENLKKMFLKRPQHEYNVFTRRLLFPTVAITPPIIIAYCTRDISMLVSYTGSFTGGILIFLIPVLLVYFARKQANLLFGENTHSPHTSPFRSKIILYILVVWYICSIGTVIYYKIRNSL